MAERYYRVSIQYRNGANAAFDAQEFDIDVANIGVDPENTERQPHRLIRFSYTGRSGEEVPPCPSLLRPRRSGRYSIGGALLGIAA
jgi:hypothetical protein